MNQTDLPKVNALVNELNQINLATQKLNSPSGRITAMIVSDDQPGMPVSVPTQYIQPPPGMLDQIKVEFNARKTQIVSELQALGITGINPPQAQAAAARRK